MTNLTESSPHYEVGYCQPPEKFRFKPGQSGNPNGRPKGRERSKNELRAIFEASISIQDGLKKRSVTRLEALLLKEWERAIRGDQRAAQAVLTVAKQLGLFSEPKWDDVPPICGLSKADIALLSETELAELIELETQRTRKVEEYASRRTSSSL